MKAVKVAKEASVFSWRGARLRPSRFAEAAFADCREQDGLEDGLGEVEVSVG